MSLAESLLPEWDQEWSTTRKLLALVPDADPGWKPHPKSMTIGRLAGHLAEMPGWATNALTTTELDIGGDYTPRICTDTAANVAFLDRNVAAARAALAGTPDAAFFVPWQLKRNGVTLLTLPRIAVYRSFVMNHSIHHRAQLSVYLRLHDIPLPSMYGPTADNPM